MTNNILVGLVVVALLAEALSVKYPGGDMVAVILVCVVLLIMLLGGTAK